ncbi:MAG: sensor histidine kinase [Bacteroidetes bacterium]|nr:MAG: sensor histidine kinase [Bacteroidota bacterium]
MLAQESGYAQGLVNGSATLAKVYRSSGNDADAYETLQNSLKVKDSLFNVGSEAKMAEMQTLYETEKKQQQIELQQEQLSKKNFILTGIIVIFCLAALLGFSSYRRYRLQQKSRLQAEIMSQQHMAAKAVLDAEEKERQRIAKDLHDSVGQMMSAAKMNLSAFESEIRFEDEGQQLAFERIIQLVDESCKEVRNVSHNMMPNALLKNNLASALREFIDKLDQKKLQVDLYTQGLDERLDTNVETVLYRVIQECVNNVIRHAAATTLDISLIKDKDGISATVEDNGSGFDTADKQKLNGMGLKNIITRIEYLKGTVEFDSTPGKGTLVALHVPV